MPVFSEKHKEMIHWIMYDRTPASITELNLEDEDPERVGFKNLLRSGNVLSFFQDVQRKTKLETNLDTSGMLSRNSFEVRAMRVVIAPLHTVEKEDDLSTNGTRETKEIKDTKDTKMHRAIDENLEGGCHEDDLPRAIEEFIYNSVTTLRVGEKVYMEAPTFNFPAAAGPFGGNGSASASHGEPNPTATFRFAEPITIPSQQSFRVEISFPRGIEDLTCLPNAKVGVWVLLDGYLTRDVM